MSRRSRLGSLGVLVSVLVVVGPFAAGAAPEPVRWVALGDSYTAGVFVGTPTPPLGGAGRDGCDRTADSYPDVVSRRLAAGAREVRLTDVSCGAATIEDVHSARQQPVSPVRPPADGWPAVAAQLDRVDAGTDVITIGVGGNSLPVASMVAACLLLGTDQPDDATPCRDAYENGHPIFAPEPVREIFQRVFREYVDLLEAVHGKAPDAKVVTVGYPVVFPQDAAGCDRADATQFSATVNDTALSMTKGDIEWLHSVLAELNSIIEDVTDLVDHGYVFVDTATSSEGHDVCAPVGAKWVEGVCGAAEDYWPASLELAAPPLTFELSCPEGTRATIVHPNRQSHADTAIRVEVAVRAAIGG
ncbi:SGNH/GDSL hydrolase family protein [Actinosynnema sp. NPDC047251]|uniref:SGNH/GDSL hydrolase family protein n=1 Tax=Saccharothrix espanaensis TaxID=103731 RepID=UPI0003164815|nr:SGNH/GDSL hydrolase family protein [Saccharothrix espanaensis]